MNNKYKSQLKYVSFSPKLSKLRQKLSKLIKEKSSCMKIIFNNKTLVKGGVYLHYRKCGNPSCKCATTSYRHPSYYLYKSEQGTTKTIYLKEDEVSRLKILTENYKRFRQARAELIKNEREIMKVINEIEKEKTVIFRREGKNEKEKPKQTGGGKNKKK